MKSGYITAYELLKDELKEKPFQNAKDYLLTFKDKFLVNTNIYDKFVLSGSPLSVLEHFDSIVTK